MLDHAEFYRWHETADASLEAARLCAGAGLHHLVCVHAEQAAQQYLKGLLWAVGSDDRARGHDLAELVHSTTEIAGAEAREELLDGAVRLARHYIAARYPDAHFTGSPLSHYRRADADQAYEDAERIARFVQTSWQDLLTAEAHEEGEAQGERGQL